MSEEQEQGRSRQQDAVLVCLASSNGPMTTETIMITFAKVGSARKFGDAELREMLDISIKEGLVEELNTGFYRISSEGRTALGPLVERPLSEI